MYPWAGKWALVTGASAGIGVALAAELAAGGTNLVLTARREDRLMALARDLAAKHNIHAEICVADLADPSAPDAIFEFVGRKNLRIDLLVNNAGFGAYGEFAPSNRARQVEMVQVNCSAVVSLTHLFLQPMLQRKSGDILIVASTAAFQAVPYIATYAATKVFDLHFAEGLAEEVKPFGIRVCGLCPGSTESEFNLVASNNTAPRSKRPRETAEKVARVGLQALAAGKTYVISGRRNYFGAHFQRLATRHFVTTIAAKLFRPPAKTRA
jgi:short-subunit dehydrogenase